VNKEIVTQHIRFGIDQSGVHNRHFEFEHICRHITKARICSNVIPATGPVQSGGDQGRDFETFYSYLKASPIANNTFLALLSEVPIVFACSLQEKPATPSGKITQDVNTICKPGLIKPERIYFFSGQDIPVGKRHERQKWVKEEKDIDLNVFDAQAISELLTEPDLFWIANKYLNISSEIYPRPFNSESWYETHHKDYSSKKDIVKSFEVFQDIKLALRHIYKDNDLKQDLPFWIYKMRHFVNEENVPLLLKKKAIYEIFIASLVGLDNADEQEDDIRFYLKDLHKIHHEADLRDASVLITFVKGETHFKRAKFSISEVEGWVKTIIDLIDEELTQDISSSRFCVLTTLKAQQLLSGIRGNINQKEDYFKLVDLALDEFEKLIPLIPNSNLYPLHSLSYDLNRTIERHLVQFKWVNERLENITQKVDALLEGRLGEISEAEGLADRAIKYLNAGNEVFAINILHKAKVKWVKKESLDSLIRILCTLSYIYLNLKMIFAAKYFAMCAADFAIREKNMENSSLLLKSLIQLATIEYMAGAWLNYLYSIDHLIPIIHSIQGDFDIYEDEKIRHLLPHVSRIKYFGNRFAPELNHLIDQIAKKQMWEESVSEIYKHIASQYDDFSDEDIWSKCEEYLLYKPFNDVGETRIIEFSTFGITWTFEFDNDYTTNAVVEECIAIIQIILVAISEQDTHIIDSNIQIRLSASSKIDKLDFQRSPSNQLSIWNVTLPSNLPTGIDFVDASMSEYFNLVFSILLNQSLLPDEEFWKIIESCLENGDLKNRILFWRFYSDFFSRFHDKKEFENFMKDKFQTPFSNKKFSPKGHHLLKYKSGLSPKFDENIVLKNIKRRYESAVIPIQITLASIIKNPNFENTLKRLRNEGWLDWQILMAISSAVISHKAHLMGINRQMLDDMSKVQKLGTTPEKENFIVIPENVYSYDNINLYLKIGLGTILRSYGLKNHGETPNFDKIREFLNLRFKFNEIDIEELSPFPPHH